MPNALNFALYERWPRADGAEARVARMVSWAPERTAAIVCDMWDAHWCRGASDRVGEMVGTMERVLCALRDAGVLIIHAPSDTMAYYAAHPGRVRALAAPSVPLAPMRAFQQLPVDASDGGCDCAPRCAEGSPWTRQHPALIIREEDAIADREEAIYLLRQLGITNVLMMGVHTNMCVVGRAFGLYRLVSEGFQTALVRDLTDTMYNHARPPYVSHFEGTRRVCDHIERCVCATITSDQIIGGQPFAFEGA